MLISVKTFIPATVALKLVLLFANTLPATASPDGTVNCSNTTGGCGGLLADDEAPCPPDSSPSDPSDPGSPCVCRMTRCVQHVCRFGFIRQLKRTGTNTPGNCCDVHECVQPKEKNCSDVICPDEGIGCPADSYRLPNHRAPGDCCSHPQGCECLPGSCPEPECVSGQYPKVMRPGNQQPGTCCPLFKCVENEVNNSCILNGKVMKNGSTWWKNECTECSCNNGLTFCAERTTRCPELPITCRETRIPSGKCCPICVEADPEVEGYPLLSDGCLTSAGKIIQNEGTWQEDPCTSCTCVAGTQKCIAYMCVLRCEHPRYVPDECCPLCNATSVVTIPPHCPALSNCSLRCLHGFVRDDAGCYSCQCQAEECLVECPDGYKQDSHGNKLCECAAPSISRSDCPPLTGCHKNCSHGFRLNKAGCEVCKCRECRPLADCNKNCAHGLRRNDRGCQICKCKASPEHIPDISVNNHIITETSCISADGQYHDDGEAWFDGCRQCLCYAGVEMCNLITCPVPTCTDPVFNSSQDCCPRCSGLDHKDDAKKLQQPMVCHSVDGVYRVEGETWPLDACTRCLCHSGRVLCETRKCPPVPCSKPVYQPGKCCPQCPNSSPIPSLRNAKLCAVHRPHGSIWMEDNCRSCICLNGETSCYTQQCPPVSCGRPVLAKNQCCPMCLEQSLPKTCTVGNVTYHLDEEWNEDACTQCKCSDGQKMCTKKVCSISCTKPVKKPGKCCPICSEADNNSYANSVPAPEDSSLGLFMESTYIIIILVLLGISTCLALYIGYQCHRHRQQLKLESMPKSCPNPAYHGYTHRNLYLPPTYTRGDRHKSKVDPYQYKCVSPYDTQQINDMYKTPSYEETEKSALNSV